MTSTAAQATAAQATAAQTATGASGEAMLDLMREIQPFPRSITGAGVRSTLAAVARRLKGATPSPLVIHEVPSGTDVLDWTVPKEWIVREAWLADPSGKRVVDVADDALHLLGYSSPVRATMPLADLRPHLFTLPDHPDRIPYRTSYYNDNWGFCLTDAVARALPDGDYTVHIDTELVDGSLTYGELVVPGAGDAGDAGDEILVTTHVCHPSMANDNLTGIAMAVSLARHVAAAPRRFTYRFLFIPGTIGSITWLARNRDVTPRIRGGLVLTGLGDASDLTYKRSRQGDATVDRAVELVLATSGEDHRIVDFSPYGYDERQFCSPGFDLPVGRFGRGQHGEYSEYHTSADDFSFVSADRLTGAYDALVQVIDVLERDRTWMNLAPHGEPQLGRRGLYRAIGSTMNRQAVEMGLLWVLNLSDGRHTLLDIATRSGLSFTALADAADALAAAGLLAPIDQRP